MNRTIFKISKMDCPTEEQIIRMRLDELKNIQSLEFDLDKRLLEVVHTGDNSQIFQQLDTLKFDTSILSSVSIDYFPTIDNQNREKKIIIAVLLINFSFFVIEMLTGIISYSMGLVADSLDMLADSSVYGLALFAVGGTIARKKNIARFTGYFQIVLAVIGIVEVIRRFVGIEKMPDFSIMIIISIFALIANAVSLYLLQRNKSKEAHLQAIMICTSNDVIINAGVILAGILVNWLNNGYPDLIIGAVVFVIVARGAYRILQLSK